MHLMGKNAERQLLLEKTSPPKRESLHRGKFIEVYREVVQKKDGSFQTWDLVTHPGGVAIVPINTKKEIVLVQQWRRAIKKISLELPAGLLEKGEEPLFCAQRELQEETGFKALSLISWGGFYVAPGFSNEFVHLFLAKELTPAPLIAEDTEEIDIVSLSSEEAKKSVLSGQICDAKTIIGILKWLDL